MAQNLIAFFAGRKGSGKSTLVKECVAEFPRVVILDTMGEYGKEEQTLESAIQGLLAVSDKRRFFYPVRLVHPEDGLRVLRVVYDIPDSLVVVEETSFYCSPSYLPDEMARLVRYGRHRQISQFYVARRPAEIHRDLTAQSDIIVSFVQHEPADVEYLRKVMGPKAELLPRLPKYAVMVSGDIEKAPLAVLERIASTPKNFRLTDSEGPI